MPINPVYFSMPASLSLLGLIEDIGKKVALPAFFAFKSFIACLASWSVSTIMFCIAAPNAISIAVEYKSSSLIILETTPHIPIKEPFFLSFNMNLTLCVNPSILRSSSSRRRTFRTIDSESNVKLSASDFKYSFFLLFSYSSFSYS